MPARVAKLVGTFGIGTSHFAGMGGRGVTQWFSDGAIQKSVSGFL